MKKNVLITGILVWALIMGATGQNTAMDNANAVATSATLTTSGTTEIRSATAAGPVCDATGTRSEGWYSREGLIRYENCKGCFAACKYAGSKSEGWYSSCDGSLIKYGLCSTQTTPTPPAGKCIDSDGGLDYYKAGKTYVEGSNAVAVDACLVYSIAEGSANVKPASTLIENYCTTDGSVGSAKYECPSGCENGACLSSGECSSDSDCVAYFSHCSCSWVCGKASNEPRIDCARMCPVGEETAKPECSCIGGKCVNGNACVGEGRKGSAIMGERCCEGLSAISNSIVSGDMCAAPTDGSFICARCGDGACGPGENACNCPKDCGTTMKETVTCVFKGSGLKQECYSEKGRCAAYPRECRNGACPTGDQITCVAEVEGKKGEVLTWKSTCGGYAKTIVDGSSEKAEFDCGTSTCIGEGEKGIINEGLSCCTGLQPSASYSSVDGKCLGIMDSSFVCIRCGDGVCGKGENACNCQKDCGTIACTTPACNGAYKSGEYDSAGCPLYKCPIPTCTVPVELQKSHEAAVRKYKALIESGASQEELARAKDESESLRMMVQAITEKCMSSTTTLPEKPVCQAPAELQKQYEMATSKYRALVEAGASDDELWIVKEEVSRLKAKMEYYLQGCETIPAKPTPPILPEKDPVRAYKARLVDILRSDGDSTSQIVALKKLREEIDGLIRRLSGEAQTGSIEGAQVIGAESAAAKIPTTTITVGNVARTETQTTDVSIGKPERDIAKAEEKSWWMRLFGV